jgi:cell shape-determining protein MreC
MRRIVVVGVIGLSFIILLSLSPSLTSSLKINLAEFFSPLQRIAHTAFTPVGVMVVNIGRVIQAARVNPLLEERVVFLSGEVTRLREMEGENEALRALLVFKRKQPYTGIVARVIGRDLYHWNQSVLIDKGGADGISKESPVVSAQGVVGKVIEVAPHLSRVLLIIDRTSGVGGGDPEFPSGRDRGGDDRGRMCHEVSSSPASSLTGRGRSHLRSRADIPARPSHRHHCRRL